MQTYNEETVIERLQKPATCRDAFTQVVAHYSEPLYWLIRKMVISHEDTDDLLQNTFMKAWGSIEYFRGDAKLSTWLYRIAVNESLTFLTKQPANQTHIHRRRGQLSFRSTGVGRMVRRRQNAKTSSESNTETTRKTTAGI